MQPDFPALEHESAWPMLGTCRVEDMHLRPVW